MAAFFALVALWCVEVYFGENWGEVRLAGLGLAIIALSNFIVWLVMLPQLDRSRQNIYTYGIAYGLFATLLIYSFFTAGESNSGSQPTHMMT